MTTNTATAEATTTEATEATAPASTSILTKVANGEYTAKDGKVKITLSPKTDKDPKECISTMWSAVQGRKEVARERTLPLMKAAIAAL
jgi:hypothetical protein